MKKSILLCLLLCACNAFAQTFDDYTKNWATYFGGQGTRFTASVVDSRGNVIAAGEMACRDLRVQRDEAYFNQFATRPDLPYDTIISGGVSQTLIAKFSPEGLLLASGYLPFYTYQMEIDNADNLYILGYTRYDTIGTPNVWHPVPQPELISEKAVIIKLDANFETIWCSYLPSQSLASFCFDGNYNIYGVSETCIDHSVTSPNSFQPDFITEYNASGGRYDNGLIFKLNNDGQLQWSSYYGVGTWGRAIAYSYASNELVTSFFNASADDLAQYDSYYYSSGAYQQTASAQIISRFNAATGQRTYSTYLGNSDLTISGIIAGESGCFFLGTTTELANGDLISSDAFQSVYGGGLTDLYLGRFAPDGSPIWGTYIGGNGFEMNIYSILLKYKSGALYFTACTDSEDNFINSPNPYQDDTGGVLLMKFSLNGDFIWGSRFGGESGELFGSISPVNDSVLYLVGQTLSQQNISTPGSYQENISFHPNYYYGLVDGNGFIAKFAPEVVSSVAEVEDKPFLLYPNPVFDNELTIAGAVREGYVLKIYSLLGQNLFQTNLTASLKQTIEIPTLSSGTYILSIFDNKRQLYTSKITKQ